MSELPLLLLALAAIFASNGCQGLRQGGGLGRWRGDKLLPKHKKTQRTGML